jgi:site-specific recombinase XerC
LHVAAYIKTLKVSEPGNRTVKERTAANPTRKQHLAAIRMLFDWLVVGQVLAINPAHAVRGPKHSVKRGKTRVLTEEQARRLMESIKVVKKVTACSKWRCRRSIPTPVKPVSALCETIAPGG